MLNFNDLELPLSLKKALEEMKFVNPTPIQEKTIPLALNGSDVIGCAQTGTGKTAAYGIPTIIHLLNKKSKRALVLVPTRELAQQVEEVLRKILRFTPEIKTAVLIGGVAMGPQVRALKNGPHLIVATPGRLVDHLTRKNVELSTCDILVLDEADRMLDMGFAPQLERILRFLPRKRQTLLFSATFDPRMKKLAARYQTNPAQVTIGTVSKPIEKIKQSVLHTTVGTKNDMLMDELNAREGSILIFARTKRRTDRLASFLLGCGYKAGRIHGDRTQKQRNDAIDQFRRGKFKILVATDIAARGIDIPHIAHVINYDLPMVAEDYVHRIGRTARAGAEGNAISLLTPEDRKQWKEISRVASIN